jgi:DNA-binding transcriptional ArsR family regulator
MQPVEVVLLLLLVHSQRLDQLTVPAGVESCGFGRKCSSSKRHDSSQVAVAPLARRVVALCSMFDHNRTMEPLLTRPVAATTDIPVDVRVSQAAECLIGLRLTCMPRLRCRDLEIGCEWFDRIRTLMPPEVVRVRDTFHRFKHAANLWLVMIGMVADGPATVPELCLLLEGTPASELWSQMLGLYSRQDSSPTLELALRQAGTGDLAPLERELRNLDRWSRRWVPEVVKLFHGDAEVAKHRVLSAIRLWYAHVFLGLWPDLEPILERDAAAKRRLAQRLSGRELLDRATNGLEYVPEVGIDRLVLLPTYLERPWIAEVRQRRTLVISYPAEDEASGNSDESQVASVLKYARVLGEETRVRALRSLAGSSLTLQQLSDELGVSKSTMHHHLTVLRSVGLLRVRSDVKRYSLRREALSELGALLDTAFRK